MRSTCYAGTVREWIPVPGSVKARLLAAAIAQFEAHGFEAASVTEIARQAKATTGAIYHHFDSKLGLFEVVREEMERRVRDRMEGAWGAVGGSWPGVAAALLVGFDAAIHFKAARILSDPAASGERDVLCQTLRTLAAGAPSLAPDLLIGAWRAALTAVAGGSSAEQARLALKWVLRDRPS